MQRPHRPAQNDLARRLAVAGLMGAFGVAVVAGASGTTRAAPRSETTPVASIWQHHQMKFFFYGYSTRYTCDALEGEVRRILIFLGARADASVKADCPRGPYVPDESAWVAVGFDTLVPAHTGAGPTVQGHWVHRVLEPRHPIFMEDGDCFLIEDMRSLLTTSFATNGQVLFRTDCMPHSQILDSYNVEGDLLAPQHPELPSPELGNNSGRDNSGAR